MKKARRGFSFVDLVIAALVVAVLCGLGFGGYDYGVRMHRRSAAQDCLRTAAAAMRRAHAATDTYQGAAIPSCPVDVLRYYTDVTFASGPSDDAYVLQISPKAGTKQAGDACGRLTIDEAGHRTAESDQFCL